MAEPFATADCLISGAFAEVAARRPDLHRAKAIYAELGTGIVERVSTKAGLLQELRQRIASLSGKIDIARENGFEARLRQLKADRRDAEARIEALLRQTEASLTAAKHYAETTAFARKIVEVVS